MAITYPFPYITSIHVNNCYAYQDFDIVLNDHHKPFSHLVLTGKNGSGKSTILKGLHDFLYSTRRNPLGHLTAYHHQFTVSMPPSQEYMYSFFHVNRKLPTSTVSSVTNENDILQALNSENFNGKFKQYLVNKKVEQAFALLQDNTLSAKETDRFFGSMNNIFRRIFEDAQLELFFSQKDFEFYFQFSNGQKVIFEHLSDGYSAMLFILLNLLIKTDLIRKSIFDYTINPCGVVLIDEPENHLHLKLQYEIMPLLTTLFPNIQFVIATHSPAVISSIKNATVFDLTSKSTESDRIVGSSFSELMISHFGLENEFSPIADAIFEELNQVIRSIENPQQRKARLQEILQKNEAYLSPSMQLEIESMILNTHQDIS